MKKQTPKQNAPAPSDEPKAARFEYQGKPAKKQQQPSNSKNETQASKSATPNAGKNAAHSTKKLPNELTIREDHTVEQLDTLTKKYKESLKVRESTPTTTTIATSKTSTAKTSAMSTGSAKSKLPAGGGSSTQGVKSQQQLAKTNRTQPKQLATLTEKRQNLKQQLKRRLEPSAQDIETFKRQSQKTRQEYNEIMKTSRPRINLVVVGHVDAGKSTLVGHLLFKLNEVSSQQMHKNQRDSKNSGKASFKFAWALDETKEERDRGVTIDIALTKFSTNHKDVVLLDAPGHVDFIPAVISGAAQADAALLVVDATKGEFETGFSSGGQTREHTFLVRSLGVKSLVVVVNKMDNVNWNAHRFTDIVEQLKPFLKQVGFNLEQDVQFVVCSGLTGENLTERRMDKIKRESSHPQLEGDDSQINWNTMPSLLEAIDQMKEPERLVDKPTRVCVTDVFKGMSSGVFLGGKVAAGKLEVKQKLLLLPPNEGCEVKQVEVRETSSQRAFAGDIITTTITGVDMNKFYRGCILCDPLIPCLVSNRFHARVIILDSANAILIKGTPIEVHINGSYESGEVKRLLSLLNKNTGELIQKKPRCLAKNASAIISIRLARSVCCELYEDNKILGRFMIRCLGKTIAAGLITKVKPAKLSKNRTKFKSK